MTVGCSKAIGITPLLFVSDVSRSVAFYRDVLGFREPSLVGSPPSFGMLNRDNLDLMLKLATSKEWISPNGRNGSWDLYIKVEDLQRDLESLRHSGIAVDVGPRRTEYGMLEAECSDPDGYRICLAQDVG